MYVCTLSLAGAAGLARSALSLGALVVRHLGNDVLVVWTASERAHGAEDSAAREPQLLYNGHVVEACSPARRRPGPAIGRVSPHGRHCADGFPIRTQPTLIPSDSARNQPKLEEGRTRPVRQRRAEDAVHYLLRQRAL